MVWGLKEKWIASYWRKGILSLSGPIFLVLYNSFLCHCLTHIITKLPESFFLPSLFTTGKTLLKNIKNKDANVFIVLIYVCV